MKRRRFLPNVPIHIYQRSLNGTVIFYSLEDCLVYYTIFCTCAKRSGITVLGLCEMYDHIHQLLEAPDLRSLSDFERMVNIGFSREFFADLRQVSAGAPGEPSTEQSTGYLTWQSTEQSTIKAQNTLDLPSCGHLFQSPFGSAPKVGDKAVRTCIAYLNNNPVERHIHSEAIKWRWNFLAYAFSDHPYSERIVKRRATYRFRRCLREVEGCHSRGEWLRHSQLRRMFSGLTSEERNQLVDFIVVTYNVIEYDRLSSYYGSREKMLLAINSNTGSEYDIKEERHRNPDTAYGQMINYVIRNEYVRSAKAVLLLSIESKNRLKPLLVRDTLADEWQAMKFLGLDPRSKLKL